MTFARLVGRSLVHYRRTHLAAALGIAVAVAVVSGSLLVGVSVKSSLRAIATGRLGNTSVIVGATQPFTEELAARLAKSGNAPVAPLLSMPAVITHESSSRRATRVTVFGVDDRFFALHGVAAPDLGRSAAWLSDDLAREIGAVKDDAVIVRISRPTDIPIDSLHGRREDAGRAIRLITSGTLTRAGLGEFTLAPTQGPVRNVFVSLSRLQRDLGIEGRVNLILAGTGATALNMRVALASQVQSVDLGLTVGQVNDTVIVESRSGLLSDDLVSALRRVGAERELAAAPVLTWLATTIRHGEYAVPYSLVSAISPGAAGQPALERLARAPAAAQPPPLVLNEWTARELRVQPGAPIELEYYRWADEGRLVTERATFRLDGVIPMSGAAIDRRWAPDYPGITTATDVSDWDPPFPIDLKRVRKQDEDYWDQYKTSPKAFIPLAAGQAIWRSRHGQATSVRFRSAPQRVSGAKQAAGSDALRQAIERKIDPVVAGLSVVDLREQHLKASAGATDFGAYFSYFSFFLMISALLLAALFFRLGIEQRLQQLGWLRAAGFSLADLRKLLIAEGAVIVAIGTLAGVLLAAGWAGLMMFALRTWWVGAVGTTLLELHVDPFSLAVGAVAAAVAALAAIAWTVRSLSHQSPRAQIAGAADPVPVGHQRRRRSLAPVILALAVVLSTLSLADLIPAAAGFFGAGALVLAAGLFWFSARLAAPHAAPLATARALAMRNAAWRPGRSLTVAGLVAAAIFLLVSVDSFRKTSAASDDRTSGTGGFALVAESAIPIVHELQTPEGREAAGISGEAAGALANGVDILSLRLRPGDDASCLNLYQPKQPRIAGVPDGLARDPRFAFARVIGGADDAARAYPWRLLTLPDAEGIVPAIVDATSLQYVLHASVGDVILVDAETVRPLRLRIVASLADSVLQGEILIGDAAFRAVFPDNAGYRLFLISVASPDAARRAGVMRALEAGLSPYGFDAEDARVRLDAFHRVENTYLSTFQALGTLGLVLGCVGLIAVVLRNVLERRRELALLGAAGFTGADLRSLVATEHAFLVVTGLGIGLAAAALAIAPVLVSRGGAPIRALLWIVPVAVAGLAAAWGAARSLRRLPLVESLRND
jgi:ABC-type antimicrobial peptide transport system permease subunit